MAVAITFDKSSYNTGDLITATVTTDPGERDVYTDETGTITVAFPSLSGTGTFTVHHATGTFEQPTVTDSLGKVWAIASDDGTTLVLTATA